MRDRQDDPSPETSNEPASKWRLEDKKRAALDTDDADPDICRGTD